jgi:hypothetical protein
VKFGWLPGLAVLNPQGRDPDQSFAEAARGKAPPENQLHPPINYHGYAACSAGGFYRRVESAAQHRNVLLLLRRDLGKATRALRILKSYGCFVAIAFKEAGAFQVGTNLARSGQYEMFRRLGAEADLCLSSTPDLVPIYAAVSRSVAYLPTPYPVDVETWNFGRAQAERRGIFLGTRELRVPSRHHLLLLAAVRLLPYPITVVEPDRRRFASLLRALGFPQDQVRVSPGLPYVQYLRLVADHRLIVQFDESRVPGQVAGDGALCRIPTVGGNGAIERLICPFLNGHGRDFGELMELAKKLMHDDQAYREQVSVLETSAQQFISFRAIRAQLAKLFPGL